MIDRRKLLAARALQNRILQTLAARCSGFALGQITATQCHWQQNGGSGCPRGNCQIDDRNARRHFTIKRIRKGASIRTKGTA